MIISGISANARQIMGPKCIFSYFYLCIIRRVRSVKEKISIFYIFSSNDLTV